MGTGPDPSFPSFPPNGCCCGQRGDEAVLNSVTPRCNPRVSSPAHAMQLLLLSPQDVSAVHSARAQVETIMRQQGLPPDLVHVLEMRKPREDATHA